jgi:VanZ family protein
MTGTETSPRPSFRIKNWLPAVAWAGMIFLFSTEIFSSSNTSHALGSLSWLLPHLPHEMIASIHVALRKIGHGAEYFVLSVLVLRALQNDSGEKNGLRHGAMTLVVVFLYALSDEWHQSFVPSREASLGDVMIDVLGGICGISWMLWYQRRIRSPLRPPLEYRQSLGHDDKAAKKT